MINLQPTTCNLCGGKVIYITNDKIYGKKYGSGYCYYCTQCGAYVGTHKPRPKEALGILADDKMKKMKIACHSIFDRQWKGKKASRQKCYKKLADKMEIPISKCHFGYFDYEQLKKAYKILKEWEFNNEYL